MTTFVLLFCLAAFAVPIGAIIWFMFKTAA